MNANKKITIFCTIAVIGMFSLFVYKSSNKNLSKQVVKNNKIEESNSKEEKREIDDKNIINKKYDSNIDNKDNKLENQEILDGKVNKEDVKKTLRKMYCESKKDKKEIRENKQLENLSLNKKVFKKNFEEGNINVDSIYEMDNLNLKEDIRTNKETEIFKESLGNKELDSKKNEDTQEKEEHKDNCEKEFKDKKNNIKEDNLKIVKFKNIILKLGQKIPKQVKAIIENGREKYLDVKFLDLKDTNKIEKSKQKIFYKGKEYEIEVEIVGEDIPITIGINNNFVNLSIEDGRLENKYLSIEILDENQNIKFLSQERTEGRECSFRTFLPEGKYQAIITVDGEFRSLSESFLINKENKNKVLLKSFKLKNDEIQLTFNENIKNNFKTNLELKNNIKISYDGFDFKKIINWNLELKGKDLILKNTNHKEKIDSLIIEQKSLKSKKGIENERIVIEDFNHKKKTDEFEPIIKNSQNNIYITFNNSELRDLEINALIKNKENSNIEFLCQERFSQNDLKINTNLNKGNYVLIYKIRDKKYSKEFKVE